jgi:type IX secretion system PorP/SprF family membrane protein
MNTSKKRRQRILLQSLLLMVGFINYSFAQDYTFTNHNLTPFSLNPSLAGNANAMRFGLNYRQQWLTLGNNYHTVRASYDQNFYKQMSSLGVVYIHDNMANSIYRTNEFALIYSHILRLKEFYYIRLGVQGSMFMNYLGWDKLTFGDQYDPVRRIPVSSTIEELDTDQRTFFDFSVGANFVIENLFSIGGAVYHIAEPENGFADLNDNTLKRKFTGHANFVRDLQYRNGLFGRKDLSDNYYFLNATYQHQDKFNMLNLGGGVAFDPLILGASVKNDLDAVNVIAFLVGAHYKGLQIYYVYDLFTSKKKNGSWSHEISLIYILEKQERYPCPVTYW